jgi:uncharacterized protein YjbJ (UPF0337 family)
MGAAKDRAKGRARQVKGKAKKTVGKVTGNRKLQAKGAAEEMAGKGQTWWGRLRSRLFR